MYEEYRKQIRDHVGFWATWLPDSVINLGEIIELDRRTGLPTPVTSLGALGVRFEATAQDGVSDIKYVSESAIISRVQSSGSTSLASAIGSGGPSSDASMELSVRFAQAGSVVFFAEACQQSIMSDLATVGSKIIALVRAGKWKTDWLVVTSVVSAARSTIVIANTSNAEIVFGVQGRLSSGLSELASIVTNSTVKQRKGIGFSLVAKERAHPLFLVHRARKGVMAGSTFRSHRAKETSACIGQSDVFFEAVDP